MFRVLLIITLLFPLQSIAQSVTRDDVLQAASGIQKAVAGTDQLRLRVNRYCRITITHEPEEALLKVISTHVLSQKYDIPASEMLYVIRASVATEGQLLLWSGDCAETGAATDDPEAYREGYRLASQTINAQQFLHKANERFWDLLAKKLVAEEERSTPHEQ